MSGGFFVLGIFFLMVGRGPIFVTRNLLNSPVGLFYHRETMVIRFAICIFYLSNRFGPNGVHNGVRVVSITRCLYELGLILCFLRFLFSGGPKFRLFRLFPSDDLNLLRECTYE